jgi:hypothetical protein
MLYFFAFKKLIDSKPLTYWKMLKSGWKAFGLTLQPAFDINLKQNICVSTNLMKTLIETILTRAFESGRLQNQPPAPVDIDNLNDFGKESATTKK